MYKDPPRLDTQYEDMARGRPKKIKAIVGGQRFYYFRWGQRK